MQLLRRDPRKLDYLFVLFILLHECDFEWVWGHGASLLRFATLRNSRVRRSQTPLGDLGRPGVPRGAQSEVLALHGRRLFPGCAATNSKR